VDFSAVRVSILVGGGTATSRVPFLKIIPFVFLKKKRTKQQKAK
jgi:hypothetical protein